MRIEKARETSEAKGKFMAEARPMVFRLALMMLWAKITGSGK
jgi:hypothetical protein